MTKTRNPCFPPFEKERHNESGIVITRKNALFAGSPEGARTWAVIGSFMESCRMNGIDPLAWLTATLEKLAAGHTSKNLDALMPWNFSKAAN